MVLIAMEITTPAPKIGSAAGTIWPIAESAEVAKPVIPVTRLVTNASMLIPLSQAYACILF